MRKKRDLEWKQLDERAEKLRPYITAIRVMELVSIDLNEKMSLGEISRHIEHLEKLRKDLELQNPRDKDMQISKSNLLKELSIDIDEWSRILSARKF